MTKEQVRRLSHWQLIEMLEKEAPLPCIGKHYSEVAEQLINAYGEYVAEQFDLIKLSDECGYTDIYYIELCDDKNFWEYLSHWRLKVDKKGFITEQEIISYVPDSWF